MTMRRQSLGQFGRFVVAGLVGLSIDIAVLYGALGLGAGWIAARLLSFLAAASGTWAINRRYTFEMTASPLREWMRYLASMAGGMLLNFCVYSLVLALLPHAYWTPGFAVMCGSLSGMLINFFSAKFLVFKS